jgi:group I intron endonuclease
MSGKIGIYKISFLDSKNVYIGSSINIGRRKSVHLCCLRNNKHYNKHLQNAYNLYGENNMTFEIVVLCEQEQLLVFEEQKIKEHNSYLKGYNMVEKPTKTNFGFKHTEDNKEKMSSSAKARGRVNGKLSKKQVLEIRQKFFDGERITNLAKEYGIHRKTMREILHLRTYVDIKNEIAGYEEMIKEKEENFKKGIRSHSKGWKHTDEFKEKFRKAVSKPKTQIRMFSKEQILEIRERKKNETYKQIAKDFSVSQGTIVRIVKRQTYSEIQ